MTYDYALEPDYHPLMVAEQHTTGKDVNRMLHICRTPQDLLNKLEAVRLMCREVGCAQRYLTHDALNAIFQATYRMDEDKGTDYHQRFLNYLHKVQDEDLTLGVAMTDEGGPRFGRKADQRRLLCPRERASRRRHRPARGESDHHRRALHARISSYAMPQYDRSG